MSGARYHPKSKEIREYAESLGYHVSVTGKNHIRFVHPKGGRIIITSGTPSDGRSHLNCKKELERNLPKG